VGASLCDSMPRSSPTPSPELLAANQRLHELRNRIARPSGCSSHSPQGVQSDPPPWAEGESSTPALTALEPVTKTPAHLGWGSDVVTKAVRNSLGRQRSECPKFERMKPNQLIPKPITERHLSNCQQINTQSRITATKQVSLPLYKDAVKHYPSIGVTALKEEQEAICWQQIHT